jgi:hypothetical protein
MNLQDEITQEQALLMKLQLAFWNATFSKYESWKANGIHEVDIDLIIGDYHKCKVDPA